MADETTTAPSNAHDAYIAGAADVLARSGLADTVHGATYGEAMAWVRDRAARYYAAPIPRVANRLFDGPECERCGRREVWHPDGSCHVFHAATPAPEMEACAYCGDPTTTPLGYGECFCSEKCLNAAHPDDPTHTEVPA